MVITSKFKIVWLEQIMMKGFGTCFLQTKLCLFTLFNKSIYKMIDAFMNTELIFQPPNFKYFMDPN
jgi:hypothetical protein